MKALGEYLGHIFTRKRSSPVNLFGCRKDLLFDKTPERFEYARVIVVIVRIHHLNDVLLLWSYECHDGQASYY